MRTFPAIDLAVFSDPAEREQIKILADMGRQVSGALSRSIFPGQSPAANPVPSPSNPSSGGDLPTPVQGDLIYGTAAGWAKLPIGASGTFVSSDGTTPSWASFASTVDVARTWATLQTFKDTTIKVVDDGDVTKAFQWSLGGAATGKTVTLISSHTVDRSITLPDATTTLAGLTVAQTFTKPQTIQTGADETQLVVRSTLLGDGASPLIVGTDDGSLYFYQDPFGLTYDIGTHILGPTLAIWNTAVGTAPALKLTSSLTLTRTVTFPNQSGTVLLRVGSVDGLDQTAAPAFTLVDTSLTIGTHTLFLINGWATVQKPGHAADSISINLTWGESTVGVNCTANGTTRLTRASGSFLGEGVAIGDLVTGGTPAPPANTTVSIIGSTSLIVSNAITAGTEPQRRNFSRSRTQNVLTLPLDVSTVKTQATLQIKTRVFGLGAAASPITVSGTLTKAAGVNVSCTTDGANPSTLTRAAGDFIADGVLVGDIVTGGSPAPPTDTLITAVTAATVTVDKVVTAGTEPQLRTFTSSPRFSFSMRAIPS